MSSKYDGLDCKMLSEIRDGASTAWELTCCLRDECKSVSPHRHPCRTIDARLQSLRKRGLITYMNQRWFTVHC